MLLATLTPDCATIDDQLFISTTTAGPLPAAPGLVGELPVNHQAGTGDTD